MEYKPYVYRLTFDINGEIKHYIGARYRQYGQVANPSDLLETYFTSSKHVKPVLDKIVKKKIVKIFLNAKQCLDFESRYLARVDAMNSESFLNKSNGRASFLLEIHSKETKLKMSLAKKGKIFSDEHKANLAKNHKGNTGKKFSAETKSKMSKAQLGENNGFYGKNHSNETKAKISANSASKRENIKAKISASMKEAYSKETPIVCPHCNKEGARRQMKRWHFENCKLKE